MSAPRLMTPTARWLSTLRFCRIHQTRPPDDSEISFDSSCAALPGCGALRLSSSSLSPTTPATTKSPAASPLDPSLCAMVEASVPIYFRQALALGPLFCIRVLALVLVFEEHRKTTVYTLSLLSACGIRRDHLCRCHSSAMASSIPIPGRFVQARFSLILAAGMVLRQLGP
jgi:hypothetical protein